METKYATRMWPVGDLIAAEYNPRTITPERLESLKKSLKADPDFLHVRPIIVNVNADRRGVIVGGNMRWLAAKELGMAEVPCVEVDLTLKQEQAWNFKDNSHHGEWDMDALTELLKSDPPSFEFALPDDMLKSMLAAETPNFGEGTPDDQGNLDKKKTVICPECSHEFTP